MAAKPGVATSLIDRKVKARPGRFHQWYGRTVEMEYNGTPPPTDTATIRAVFQDKDRELKVLCEHDTTGELKEMYAECVITCKE